MTMRSRTVVADAGDDAGLRTVGTVAWFSHKGFGFLCSDEGEDVYVHHSAIVGDGFTTLPTDARVSFVTVEARRGPEALDVRILPDA